MGPLDTQVHHHSSIVLAPDIDPHLKARHSPSPVLDSSEEKAEVGVREVDIDSDVSKDVQLTVASSVGNGTKH